ncbi:MAG: hypothetical protein RLO52_29595 [Sandaracinaceae bacterium]
MADEGKKAGAVAGGLLVAVGAFATRFVDDCGRLAARGAASGADDVLVGAGRYGDDLVGVGDDLVGGAGRYGDDLVGGAGRYGDDLVGGAGRYGDDLVGGAARGAGRYGDDLVGGAGRYGDDLASARSGAPGVVFVDEGAGLGRPTRGLFETGSLTDDVLQTAAESVFDVVDTASWAMDAETWDGASFEGERPLPDPVSVTALMPRSWEELDESLASGASRLGVVVVLARDGDGVSASAAEPSASAESVMARCVGFERTCVIAAVPRAETHGFFTRARALTRDGAEGLLVQLKRLADETSPDALLYRLEPARVSGGRPTLVRSR